MILEYGSGVFNLQVTSLKVKLFVLEFPFTFTVAWSKLYSWETRQPLRKLCSSKTERIWIPKSLLEQNHVPITEWLAPTMLCEIETSLPLCYTTIFGVFILALYSVLCFLYSPNLILPVGHLWLLLHPIFKP